MHRWMMGAVALALAGAGCSHGSASQPGATTAQPAPPRAQAQAVTPGEMGSNHPMGGDMAAMCPMANPDTQVSAADTANGEALTFTTSSPDQVADLRSRVRAMADMHNQHHASGEMGGMHGHGGMMGTGSGGMGNMPMPPPSTAAVEDTDNGARLVVTPHDPAQLAELQSAVRAHAGMMQQGRCGMMGGAQQDGTRGQ